MGWLVDKEKCELLVLSLAASVPVVERDRKTESCHLLVGRNVESEQQVIFIVVVVRFHVV